MKTLFRAFLPVAFASLGQFAAGGLVTPTAGSFMEGYDNAQCRELQRKADQTAIERGIQPVVLGCTRDRMERERTEQMRRAVEDVKIVCEDQWGRMVCRRIE